MPALDNINVGKWVLNILLKNVKQIKKEFAKLFLK